MKKLRILLADDHAVLRAGLKMLIAAQGDMEVVGEAGDGREAVRQTKLHQPDLVLMDFSMPELDGAAATAEIKRVAPQVHVLALTRHNALGHLQQLLRAGAGGYVLKKSAADTLIKAIRIVAGGGLYLEPDLAGHGAEPPPIAGGGETGQLTQREGEVLRLIAWGYSHQAIADQLGISLKAVERNRTSAATRLRLNSRTDILRYGLAQGWRNEEDDGPATSGMG